MSNLENVQILAFDPYQNMAGVDEHKVVFSKSQLQQSLDDILYL